MNKNHWLTILLDGTVPFETVCALIEQSYDMTAPKIKKK
jgi:predicted DNA-binding protein (MmcQ/YjbR family)